MQQRQAVVVLEQLVGLVEKQGGQLQWLYNVRGSTLFDEFACDGGLWEAPNGFSEPGEG